jgi:hypothetical protein
MPAQDFVHILVAPPTIACGAPDTPAPGASTIEITVQWKTGYYEIDKHMVAATFMHEKDGHWKRTEAKKGFVEVRAAPLEKGSTGRIHIHAEGGADTFDAELDVSACVAVSFKKK